MKLITWNCNMAFRKKLEIILEEKPDILVIPESESPDKFILKKEIPKPEDSFWFGDNPNKGIGVYTYNDFKIKVLEDHNLEFRFIIPLLISNQEIEFILLATWCQKPKKSDNYGTHTWNSINYYTKLLDNEKVIIAGDFNSSSIWDKPNREANHTNIVNRFKERGIKSTYHIYHEEEQGKEKHATLNLHRKIDRPYHIDFCFASDYFIKRLERVKVGEYEKWTNYSDHKPLIVNFKIGDNLI
ncbi:endonuclease/exonuclease/phosphatase family protein [Psychroflexus salinarum]|uniref:Endonuclease/exonuclease/phosphatase family protein n=1 Tax=Psychroflexus salinarum TaxID=546024 RepID=A0ABW3GML9_9FLAO